MLNPRSLIAMLSLAWIPSAQATLVWFEATQSGFTYGAQGTALTLICDPPFPPNVCTWQVSMKATFGTGMHGWNLDLLTAPGNGVSISNPQIPVGSPFNSPAFPGTVGSGPSLLHNAGGQTFTVVQPQTLTLLTFTLTKDFFPGGFSTADIFGGSSKAEFFAWATNMGEYDIVQFGPNPPAQALPGQYGALPLIRIGIPEPTSLSLLVLGAAASLRRMRGHRIDGVR